eukprot:gene1418-biopygen3993
MWDAGDREGSVDPAARCSAINSFRRAISRRGCACTAAYRERCTSPSNSSRRVSVASISAWYSKDCDSDTCFFVTLVDQKAAKESGSHSGCYATATSHTRSTRIARRIAHKAHA